MKTSIHYINDSQNSISYVDKDGETITINPFDPRYAPAAERLSNITVTEYQNNTKRANYEQAVKNAQISVDNGRTYDPLPAPPECEFWPDDPAEPGTTIPWNPPLLTLKPAVPNQGTHVHGLVNDLVSPPAELKQAPPMVAAIIEQPKGLDFLERLLGMILSHAGELSELGFKIADKA